MNTPGPVDDSHDAADAADAAAGGAADADGAADTADADGAADTADADGALDPANADGAADTANADGALDPANADGAADTANADGAANPDAELARLLALARSGNGIEHYRAAEAAAAVLARRGDLDALLQLAVGDRLAREYAAGVFYDRRDVVRLRVLAMDGSPAGCSRLAHLLARSRDRAALSSMRALVPELTVTVPGRPHIEAPAPSTGPPPDPDESWTNPHEAADCARYWWDVLRAMDGDRSADESAVRLLDMVDDTEALQDLAAAGSGLARSSLAARRASAARAATETDIQQVTDAWMRAAGID